MLGTRGAGGRFGEGGREKKLWEERWKGASILGRPLAFMVVTTLAGRGYL